MVKGGGNSINYNVMIAGNILSALFQESLLCNDKIHGLLYGVNDMVNKSVVMSDDEIPQEKVDHIISITEYCQFGDIDSIEAVQCERSDAIGCVIFARSGQTNPSFRDMQSILNIKAQVDASVEERPFILLMINTPNECTSNWIQQLSHHSYFVKMPNAKKTLSPVKLTIMSLSSDRSKEYNQTNYTHFPHKHDSTLLASQKLAKLQYIQTDIMMYKKVMEMQHQIDEIRRLEVEITQLEALPDPTSAQ